MWMLLTMAVFGIAAVFGYHYVIGTFDDRDDEE